MEWRKHKTGDVTGRYTAMMWKNNKQLRCEWESMLKRDAKSRYAITEARHPLIALD